MNTMTNFLYWISGTDAESIKDCSNKSKMIRCGLGLIFLINYCILLMTWTKVGMRYFGLFGILPGVLAPTAFLAFDRLIAMTNRKLRGILAVYNQEGEETKNEIRLRVFMAIAMTLMTTITFQMSLADSVLRDKIDTEWKMANRELRANTLKFIEGKYEAKKSKNKTATDTVTEGLKLAEERMKTASKEAMEASKKSLEAHDKARGEESGDERYAGKGVVSGRGVKMMAADRIAEANKSYAKDKAETYKTSKEEVEKLRDKLEELQKELVTISNDKNKELSMVDQTVMESPYYVPKREGLFSDTTIFLGLYIDPKHAAGAWLISILTWMFLVALELLALFAIYIQPTNDYDLKVIVKLREDAAKIITEYELARMGNANQDVVVVEPHGERENHEQ